MPRVHRYDVVARLLQVPRDGMAGTIRPGREPHDGDRPGLLQQRPEGLGRHASGRCTWGVPLTARPTSTTPARPAIVSASVDGTLGVAT